MKKNNKGFSLVELIVVVLIMGIIAVALAPQVVKWVQTSRESKDVSAEGAVITAIQSALVTYKANNKADDLDVTVTYGQSGVAVAGTNTEAKDKFEKLLLEELGLDASTSATYTPKAVTQFETTITDAKINGTTKITGMKYFDTLMPEGMEMAP